MSLPIDEGLPPTGDGAAGHMRNTYEADLSPSLGSGVVPAAETLAVADGESATNDLRQQPTLNSRTVSGRPWPKGVSGNPKGRPRKGETLIDVLGKRVNKRKVQVAHALVDAAESGNVRAFVAIRDTLYGIPEQKLRISQEESPLEKLLAGMRERRTIEGEYTVKELSE